MPAPVDIFPWNANFETGIAIIDTQHQKLVGLLNRLVGHIAYHLNPCSLQRAPVPRAPAHDFSAA